MVGKTCLFVNYFKNIGTPNLFENDVNNNNNNTNNNNCIHNDADCGPFSHYSPTALSVYRCDIKINSAVYSLSMTDPSGSRSNDKFVQLRKHYYSFTKVIEALYFIFVAITFNKNINSDFIGNYVELSSFANQFEFLGLKPELTEFIAILQSSNAERKTFK